MPDFGVYIESPPGVTNDDDAFEKFVFALNDDGRILTPDPGLDTRTGVLTVGMRISAPTRGDAALTASLIYWGALGAAGLDTNADSRVLVTAADGNDSQREFVSQRPIRP